jgi:hypothetical protein
MDTFTTQGSEHTPAVALDKEHGRFEISGRSFMEDPLHFYAPVLDWLKDYAKQPNTTTEFLFSFDYYNTETGKFIFDILFILDRIEGAKVIWRYADQDRDMEEAGLDYAELVNLPFEFKTF